VAGGLNAKFDHVKDIINKKNPAAFFIFESNLKIDKCHRHLNIPNYDLVTTESSFSRTACYLRKNSCFRVKNLGGGNEAIALESKSHLIIGVYRPFKVNEGETSMGNFEKLLKYLEDECNINKEIIVAGDMNVDLKSNRHLKLRNAMDLWASNNGLCQQIEDYTWHRVIQKNNNLIIERSSIDHFYTSDVNQKCEIKEHYGSDHHILTSSLITETISSAKLQRRDWRRYNRAILKAELKKREEKITDIKNIIQLSSTTDEIVANINKLQLEILDTLAPMRVVKLRRATDIVDSHVSALIKKRNRLFKRYNSSGLVKYQLEARSLTKTIKQLVKKKTREKYEKKACSKDQKQFWSVVNEITGKTRQSDKLTLDVNGRRVENPEEVCEVMATYFEEKIEGLCTRTGLTIPVPIPKARDQIVTPQLGEVEMDAAIKKMKRKKSSGIDKIPMCLIVDSFAYFRDLYRILFNKCLVSGIPKIWKKALVRPLHKSGPKTDKSNYRPISNLCSLGKLYERVILEELIKINDGTHQHGFKPGCSTTTAMLTIQSKICELLDANKKVLIYSLDLSAAFDMLRVDVFYNMFSESMEPWLLATIKDFLTNRKCVVEVDGSESNERVVPLGCVQGSVLGPRLFNLYTSKIPECFPHEVFITSYADDTYVIISGDSELEIQKKAEDCINAHTKALLTLGMIVNGKKTEAIYFNKERKSITLNCNGELITTGKEMKILGVLYDEKMSWTNHIKKTIGKMNRLSAGLKFLRKRLQKKEFLKATTSQFYGLLYYGSQVWLGPHTKISDVRRLNSVHYKTLRVVENDWKKKKKRADLDKLGRAKPSLWGKYATGNLVIKTIKKENPSYLYEKLCKTWYSTRRKPGKMLFFDGSKTRIGFQSIENRIGDIFKELDFSFDKDMSDDLLRVSLKRSLKMCIISETPGPEERIDQHHMTTHIVTTV